MVVAATAWAQLGNSSRSQLASHAIAQSDPYIAMRLKEHNEARVALEKLDTSKR